MKKYKMTDYDPEIWALFFSLRKQAKYVLELDGEKSFMHPMASEIKRLLDLVQNQEIVLGLTSRDYDIIDETIKRRVIPIINNRKLSATLLILSSMRRLVYKEHGPTLELFGVPALLESLDVFHDMLLTNDESIKIKPLYMNTNDAINKILLYDRKPLAIKALENKFKNMFPVILKESYSNSKSHGINHCEDLIFRAVQYNDNLNLGVDYDEIVICGYLHDMFSSSNREKHHTLAANWVRCSMHPFIREKGMESVERMATAIEEHRSSHGKVEYSSVLSELIASADIGPLDLSSVVGRSFHYTMDKLNIENPSMTITKRRKKALNMVKDHLRVKFSRTGYQTYPDIYRKFNSDGITTLHNNVDDILSGACRLTYVNGSIRFKRSNRC